MGTAASVAKDAPDRLSKLKQCFQYLVSEYPDAFPPSATIDFDEFREIPEHIVVLLHLFVQLHCSAAVKNELFNLSETSTEHLEVVAVRDYDFENGKDVVVYGECHNLSGVGFLQYISKKEKVHGLYLPNNNIDDGSLQVGLGANVLGNLQYLNIGGNQIEQVLKLSGCCPWSLQVLDLSYSESLVFERGCFLNCPQIRHLILDGCGLETTYLTDKRSQNAVTDSIFVGLVGLEILSLKENAFETLDSLYGLEYFGFQWFQNSQIANIATNIQLHAKLTHIFLEENEILDTSSNRKELTSRLSNRIPSLLFIDKKIRESNENALKGKEMRNILRRKENDESVGPASDPNGLDSLEKEFLSALKGERDNSVVS